MLRAPWLDLLIAAEYLFLQTIVRNDDPTEAAVVTVVESKGTAII